MGASRVDATAALVFIDLAGKDGWHVEPLRWEAPIESPGDAPPAVEWVKRETDEPGYVYLSRVRNMSCGLGVARGDRQLGVRRKRGDQELRARTWRLINAPRMGWTYEAAAAMLLEAGLTDVSVLSRKVTGKDSSEWRVRGTLPPDRDTMEIEMVWEGHSRIMFLVATQLRPVNRSNVRKAKGKADEVKLQTSSVHKVTVTDETRDKDQVMADPAAAASEDDKRTANPHGTQEPLNKEQ